MADAAGACQGQTGDHRQDRGKNDTADNVLQQRAADQAGQVDNGHIVTPWQAAMGARQGRVMADMNDGAGTNYQIESKKEGNQSGGPTGRSSGRGRVPHGIKTDQDIR